MNKNESVPQKKEKPETSDKTELDHLAIIRSIQPKIKESMSTLTELERAIEELRQGAETDRNALARKLNSNESKMIRNSLERTEKLLDSLMERAEELREYIETESRTLIELQMDIHSDGIDLFSDNPERDKDWTKKKH